MVRSSVEAKYKAMAHTTCEIMCVNLLLQKMEFLVEKLMRMFCEN